MPARGITPEAQVKAAYLFKLASFVRWPDATAGPDPFRICISGRGDIAGALTTLARDQLVAGKRIAVQQLAPEQADEAQRCQMLFVGRGAQTARAMLKGAEGNAVLTVTDRAGGTRGGVIEFMVENGKVRLAIDRRLATAHRLELSSKLMDVAAEVKK
jgi:hypothetical protein